MARHEPGCSTQGCLHQLKTKDRPLMSNSSLLIVLDYLPNLMDCVAAVGEEKTIFPYLKVKIPELQCKLNSLPHYVSYVNFRAFLQKEWISG